MLPLAALEEASVHRAISSVGRHPVGAVSESSFIPTGSGQICEIQCKGRSLPPQDHVELRQNLFGIRALCLTDLCGLE